MKLLSLILTLLLIIPPHAFAREWGLNSERYYPSPQDESATLAETPHLQGKWNYTLGLTTSFAINPGIIERDETKFGTRHELNRMIWVQTLSAVFGLTKSWDVSVNFPFATLSNTNLDIEGEPLRDYKELQGKGAAGFFLADGKMTVKYNPVYKFKSPFILTPQFVYYFPMGDADSLMTDVSHRFGFQLPMLARLNKGRQEVFGLIGFEWWTDNERIGLDRAAYDQLILDDVVPIIYSRSSNIPLQLGYRHWVGTPYATGAYQLEGMLDIGFVDGNMSFTGSYTTAELMVGAASYMTDLMSVHAGASLGIAKGFSTPDYRLFAGVRYRNRNRNVRFGKKRGAIRDPLRKGYTEDEIAHILRNAYGEEPAVELPESGSVLRLLYGGQIIEVGVVEFKFASADLTQRAKESVKELYDYIIEQNIESIHIDGHTDSVGSFSYNLKLSERRAKSVKKELARLGMPANLITTKGYSYQFPINSNATASGRARNRRIEVALNGESFRKKKYSEAELRQFREWIAPGGKKPRPKKK